MAKGNIFSVVGKQTVTRGGVWAGVACARNGDLVVAFGTTNDGVWGGKVMVTRSTDGGRTWSAPGTLVKSQWKETGAAGAGSGMATLSDGTILLPFVDVTTPRIPGVPITGPIQPYMDFRGEGNYGRAYVMRSSDNGETWSTPHWIARTGTLTRPHGRILELLRSFSDDHERRAGTFPAWNHGGHLDSHGRRGEFRNSDPEHHGGG